MFKQLFHDINSSPNFWQKVKTAIMAILILGFILLIFTVNLTFLDNEYSSILGDPSRKIEHSSQYFFAGFIVLWVLIIVILFYSLIMRHKTASKATILPSTSQKILKRLEKFLILVSIVISIIAFIRYFMRIFSLTNNAIYSVVLVGLTILAITAFTWFICKDKYD